MRSFADTGEKRMLWRRIIVYSITFFVLGVVQCSFFSTLKPFGAVPDLVLGGVCAVAMLDSKKSAAVCAVAAGYFVDALGSGTLAFSPLFYLVCVAVLSSLFDKMMPNIFSFAVTLLPAVCLGAIYTYICMCLTLHGMAPLFVIWKTIIPYMLTTLVVCLAVYPLSKLGHAIVEHR